jgi:RecA/RadA recombinase
MARKTEEVVEKKTRKKVTDDFFGNLLSAAQNDLAQAASNGIVAGDIRGFIDTGVYLLNAQLCGSMYGGIPNNKIGMYAGAEAVGKTYYVLSIAKYFQDQNSDGAVFYFESESAIDKKALEARGLDLKRIFIIPVSTVQEFRTQALKILTAYSETPESKRKPLMFVLDSLGMLSTTKEMEDSEEGKETADMTRARLLKATFRVLTLKLGILNIPLLVTNHTYDTQGLFAQKVMSGGSGGKYANSYTIFLSKAKDKDGDEVTGSIITCNLKKSRLTKENTMIKTRLDYSKGLDRYYGLVDLGVEAGLIEKLDNKFTFPNGESAKVKAIYSNPEKYFTPDVMEKLEAFVKTKFCYGENDVIRDEEVEEVVEEESSEE